MRIRAIAAGLVIFGLAGCEPFAFDTVTADEQSFLDLQAETTTIRTELDTLSPTNQNSLPVNGSAIYTGTAVIALDTPTASELIGTTTLTADFGADSDIVTGQMDGFYGTINGGEVVPYNGSIFLTGGEIDRAATRPITGTAQGTLNAGTDVLSVNTDLAGNFLGATPVGISLSATDDSGYRLNGSDVTGGMDVVGLQD